MRSCTEKEILEAIIRSAPFEVPTAKITLDAVMLLPSLIGGTRQTRADFPRLLETIRRHENTHLEIARDAAHQVDALIGSVGEMSSCERLEDHINAQALVITDEMKQAHDRFDLKERQACPMGIC